MFFILIQNVIVFLIVAGCSFAAVWKCYNWWFEKDPAKTSCGGCSACPSSSGLDGGNAINVLSSTRPSPTLENFVPLSDLQSKKSERKLDLGN